MGFCKTCGKLINEYNGGYCFDCKAAEGEGETIAKQATAGNFMKKMGIMGW